MEGVAKNFNSTEKGLAEIKKFTITEEGAKQANFVWWGLCLTVCKCRGLC